MTRSTDKVFKRRSSPDAMLPVDNRLSRFPPDEDRSQTMYPLASASDGAKAGARETGTLPLADLAPHDERASERAEEGENDKERKEGNDFPSLEQDLRESTYNFTNDVKHDRKALKLVFRSSQNIRGRIYKFRWIEPEIMEFTREIKADDHCVCVQYPPNGKKPAEKYLKTLSKPTQELIKNSQKTWSYSLIKGKLLLITDITDGINKEVFRSESGFMYSSVTKGSKRRLAEMKEGAPGTKEKERMVIDEEKNRGLVNKLILMNKALMNKVQDQESQLQDQESQLKELSSSMVRMKKQMQGQESQLKELRKSRVKILKI